MVSHLQFVAVTVFLIWGLVSSLCDVFLRGPDVSRLVRRGHSPAGGAVPLASDPMPVRTSAEASVD